MKQNLIWKQQLLDGAELLDAYRVFPRIFVGLYIAGLSHVLAWAISLDDISMQQAGFISIVSGTFPFVLNFYMQTGRQWQKENQHENFRFDNPPMGEDAGVRGVDNSGSGTIRSALPVRSKI